MAERSVSHVLDRLFAVIEDRRNVHPRASYTARLLRSGARDIAQRVGEEAVEAVLAGAAGEKRGLVQESADLLYHLLVLWAKLGIAPDRVWAELARREGTSGIAEKRSRTGARPPAFADLPSPAEAGSAKTGAKPLRLRAGRRPRGRPRHRVS